jgi:hypothetical protein
MMPLFDNESVRPFKLKENLVGDSDKILFIAEKYFGKPSSKNCRWDDPVRGPCLSADWRGDWWLSISHFLGEETIKIEFRWGNRLLEYEHESIKIQSFVNDVKKPWSEWTEDEIISSPEWLMIYSEDNVLTEKMHSAMVMYSYQDSGSVKKYFNNRPLIEDESFQVGPQIQTE